MERVRLTVVTVRRLTEMMLGLTEVISQGLASIDRNTPNVPDTAAAFPGPLHPSYLKGCAG